MNEELFAAEFLTFSQISILLSSALTRENPTHVIQAYDNLSSVTPCSFKKFHDTISLLISIGFLATDDDGYVIVDKLIKPGTDDIKVLMGKAFLEKFLICGTLEDLCIAAQFDVKNDQVIVDSYAIPWSYRNLRILLLEIDFFQRPSIHTRHWRCADYTQKTFLEVLREKNEAIANKAKLSPSQLKRIHDAQALAGQKTERWVLEWERRRLTGHKLISQVSLVSESDVSAGYDIISFSGISSLNYDRYIEVKSYTDRPNFYWSAKEVETAQRLDAEYAICLVDRDRTGEENYEPTLLFDPYRRFISKEPTGWRVSTDTYFVSIDDTEQDSNH